MITHLDNSEQMWKCLNKLTRLWWKCRPCHRRSSVPRHPENTSRALSLAAWRYGWRAMVKHDQLLTIFWALCTQKLPPWNLWPAVYHSDRCFVARRLILHAALSDSTELRPGREKAAFDPWIESWCRRKSILKNICHIVNKEQNLPLALMCPQNGKKMWGNYSIRFMNLVYFYC